MSKKIVGKQSVDYVSKKTGQPVIGVTLHCVGESNRVEGMECETIFVSGRSPIYDQCVKFPLGQEINVSYNRWGAAESILPVGK